MRWQKITAAKKLLTNDNSFAKLKLQKLLINDNLEVQYEK